MVEALVASPAERRWEESAAVRFAGPRSGVLLVETDSATASMATANMLGLEEDPPIELQRDALRELANMICGHVVSGAGADAGLIQIRLAEHGSAPECEPAAEVVLSLEYGQCRVALWLLPPADRGAS